MYVHAYMYITAISEKRGYEFERVKRGIWEDLEGKREKGYNYTRISKNMKEVIFKTQDIRG